MNNELNDTHAPKYMGRYELIKELDHGGMAIVYLARDPKSERKVAIKVIRDSKTNQREFKHRFQQEVKVIARLEHHAIVPVYDVGEHDGRPYLVMRYMPGRSLRHRLENHARLPLDEVCFIAKRLGDALEKAHGKGVIHRDIKPANVLFDDVGLPYLSDFGIARLMEQTQHVSYTVAGSPPYMAPEQWTGSIQNEQTDVYQLGVMLFEMVTGHKPFGGGDFRAQHMHEAIPSIRKFDAMLPAALDDVFQKALAKEPVERFTTPKVLVTALWRAAGAEQIAGRFQVHQQIGTTRLATVYLAYDSEMDIDVALKIMHSPLLGNYRFQRAFRNEAKAIEAFAHQYVVKIYEIGKHENKPYIAMRYCSGGSLADRLHRDGPLPLSEVCDIAAQVAAAVQAIHDAGWLHRNIKPSNILLGSDGSVYLSELGTLTIAEQTTAVLENNDLLGADAYMAPEQRRGSGLDKTTDVYQLGVTLFKLLAGKRPFAEQNAANGGNGRVAEPVPAISRVNPDLPATLDPVFQKALAESPGDRYETPMELAAALREAERAHILESHYSDGQRYFSQRQWEAAVAAFETVADLDPSYEQVASYLDSAKAKRRSEEIYAKGKEELSRRRWREAVHWFKQIPDYEDASVHLQLAQKHVELQSLYTKGQDYQQRNKLKSARKQYVQIQKIEPAYRNVPQLLADVETALSQAAANRRARFTKWAARVGIVLVLVTALLFLYLRFPTSARLAGCLSSADLFLETPSGEYSHGDTVSLSSGLSRLNVRFVSSSISCRGVESKYMYNWDVSEGTLDSTMTTIPANNYLSSLRASRDRLEIEIEVPGIKATRTMGFLLSVDE